ncbi:hypothetical protein LA080_006600 [Diaporthe eres]|nr:hypothetical protein LA080_006600 [Diaporthe eres]
MLSRQTSFLFVTSQVSETFQMVRTAACLNASRRTVRPRPRHVRGNGAEARRKLPMIASGRDNNPYISWHMGMLTCIFSITGVDGVIHMSEETRRAKSAVPRAMVWSIAINGSLAIIMAAVIFIHVEDVDVALGCPNPFATIMLNIKGFKAATTAIISGFFLLGFNSSLKTISCLSADLGVVSPRWTPGGKPLAMAELNNHRYT